MITVYGKSSLHFFDFKNPPLLDKVRHDLFGPVCLEVVIFYLAFLSVGFVGYFLFLRFGRRLNLCENLDPLSGEPSPPENGPMGPKRAGHLATPQPMARTALVPVHPEERYQKMTAPRIDPDWALFPTAAS